MKIVEGARSLVEPLAKPKVVALASAQADLWPVGAMMAVSTMTTTLNETTAVHQQVPRWGSGAWIAAAGTDTAL